MCEVPYPLRAAGCARPRRTRSAPACPTATATRRSPPTSSRRCIDEFLLCDDLGLNVAAIEHHAGINSLLGANPLLLGILARQTRKARILSLGTLISLRRDPVRVAEEYATADVISRGRLEIGFVKSGGTEMASANANPVNNIERYWEAIDLITKALSHHDGPFSWEGKHFTHRHVNIWPRPWQQPHPRMWAATGDPHTAAEVGRRGMVHVLVLRGPEGTRRAYAAYRKARAEAGLPTVTTDNFAYAPSSLSATPTRRACASVRSSCGSSTRASNRRRNTRSSCPAPRRRTSRARPGARAPGRNRAGPISSTPRRVSPRRRRTPLKLMSTTVEQAMAQGIMFAGNPDSVYAQIKKFHDDVGGFGHLTIIGRTGFMTHAESEKNIRLLGKEVLPRLKAIAPMTPTLEEAA